MSPTINSLLAGDLFDGVGYSGLPLEGGATVCVEPLQYRARGYASELHSVDRLVRSDTINSVAFQQITDGAGRHTERTTECDGTLSSLVPTANLGDFLRRKVVAVSAPSAGSATSSECKWSHGTEQYSQRGSP